MHHSNTNSLPENKILGSSTSKVRADNKFNTAYFTTSVKERKQLCKAEENAGHQYFLLFLPCFSKTPSSRSLKHGNIW